MCDHPEEKARGAVVDPDEGAALGYLCSECGRIVTAERRMRAYES